MDAFSSPTQVLERLDGPFTAEERDGLRELLQAEAWASPSSRKKRWIEEPLDIPLRYELEIALM